MSEQKTQESWEELVARLREAWTSTRQQWGELVQAFAEGLAAARGSIVEGSVVAVTGEERLLEGPGASGSEEEQET